MSHFFITLWRLRNRCCSSLRALALCVMWGGCLVCTGVGLGSAVPPSCSFLSSLSLGASFPPPPATLSVSLPSVPASPGFPASSSFASPPSLVSLPPPFPDSSPSVVSFLPSLPTPVPPNFHLTPPVRPLAPPMGLRPHGPSLTPSVSPFSVAFLYVTCSWHFALSPCLF